ncbi:SAM-dependent methyltransferase [Streptomyces sp. V3I7]|uniref:SAM-dependent methyltransferase n=1 Tax=Streptomyces sp. V3I7 TaxID=3042278 RepID=UPI00277DF410|nr:SAM-dependent methyltransferase [Streptomyces sp. V3I7]MDQ0989318.1 hypothetical protein [Streptomyces sp. V3I7]
MTEYVARPLDTSRPHPARVYDWLLGGKDNYPVDEELGNQLTALEPRAKQLATQNRWFMHRAVRKLVGGEGIRQFLDIGTGIPTEPNLHQIAQKTAPESRVVYVDNDPIVLAHAEALLHGTPEGVTEYVQADVREPHTILEQARKVLDFDRPIGLSLIALLHFVPDSEGAHDIVGELVAALPAGSFLALSNGTADFDPDTIGRAAEAYKARGVTVVPRSHAEVSRFFTGLELLEPGVVSPPEWHPELATGEPLLESGQVPIYCGVARKP